MGYVSNAMATVMEAGCLWLDDDIIRRLREAGHAPQMRRVIVEGYCGPVELDALPVAEGFRLRDVAQPADRDEIDDALAEML